MQSVAEIYQENGTFLTAKHPLSERAERYVAESGVKPFDHSQVPLDYLGRRFVLGYAGKMDNPALTVGICYEKDPSSKTVLAIRLLEVLKPLFKTTFVIAPDIEYYGRYQLSHEDYRNLVESVAKIISYYSPKTDFGVIRESDPSFSLMASKLSNCMMPSDISDVAEEGLHQGEGSNVFQNVALSYHTASYFLPEIRDTGPTTLVESIHMSPRRLIAKRISSSKGIPMDTGSLYTLARPLSLKYPNSLGVDSEDMISISPETMETKVRNAITGGRDRLEDQKKYGGDFMNCPLFQNYVIFTGSKESRERSRTCADGISCGSCKSHMIKDLKARLDEINSQPTSEITGKILDG